MQSPLSESNFITIMKILIKKVEGDFLRVSINFRLIFTNDVKGWEEKGTEILKPLRLMLYLIENYDRLAVSYHNEMFWLKILL